VRMVLGTLHGEAGQTNALAQLLLESDRLHPGNRVSALLRHVYLGGTASTESIEAWPESEMVRGWAFDTLRGRLAAKREDTALADEASTEIQQRGTELQIEALLLFGTNCAVMLAGTAIILRSMRGRWGTLRRPGEPTMIRWAPTDALAVFMAGEFLATVLYPVVMWSGLWIAWFIGTYLYVLLSAAPFVLLAAVCLFQRNRVSLTGLFRLRMRTMVGGALALCALDFGGTLLLNRVLEPCNWQIPWAEALDEDLIYGTFSSKTATLVNMAVLAPFFEEFQMRAVLFAALRSRNSVFAAAFVSSTVFAVLHFYSPAGFVSVWWFGFSAALVYERTRSLPACIAGHALTNAMIGAETLLVFG
jgi:membrane protease YdiL (CAAX protease family)